MEANGLPLPDMTVITHWHWDHTFRMHAVHGQTLTLPETNRRLEGLRKEMLSDPGWVRHFLKSDPSVIREYTDGVTLDIVTADEELSSDQNRDIDLGGVTARILRTESPHTEDALIMHVPEDRVLFIGDAQLGEFPSWRMDYDKLYALGQKDPGDRHGACHRRALDSLPKAGLPG